MLPILMMQDVISVWWYRREWDVWNVKTMLPGAVVGTGLAWALASVVSDNFVRVLIGAIGVLFVLNVWFGKMPPPKKPSALIGVICGAGAAFTSTIASAGMPPFAIHVLPQRLDKMTLVGTITIFFAAVNVMRLAPYIGLGHLTHDSLLVSLTLAPLAIVTNFLGFWLVERVPTGPFYRITYALMFAISAALLTQGVVGLWRS
jgi:hypothetical protein